MIQDEDFETLLVVENLIKHLIRAVHMLEQMVKEEEDLFRNFCKWLRSGTKQNCSVFLGLGYEKLC
jgi:hypothetical protein